MQAVVIDVFTHMAKTHRCSADAILVSPDLREEYLQQMRERVGNLPEQSLLNALIKARKGSKLPRSRDFWQRSDN